MKVFTGEKCISRLPRRTTLQRDVCNFAGRARPLAGLLRARGKEYTLQVERISSGAPSRRKLLDAPRQTREKREQTHGAMGNGEEGEGESI